MKAIIEMPKGDTRRRHLKDDKSGMIDLGLIRDVIPANDGVMPVAYGYLPGTLNETEGDEVDVLVFSEREFEVSEEVEVEPIGLLRRADGDHEVLAVDATKKIWTDWLDIPEKERTVVENFFGYHHKIIAIEDARSGETYMDSCKVQSTMRKKLEDLFEYMAMLNAFRRVERVMRVAGTNRMENDQEHSYELAMMAWFLVDSENISLDRDLVIKYALVHDLVEVYAGDTYVFSKDSAELASKEHRETKARERLSGEFPQFRELHQLMVAYERREDRESRFVYALDKIHPILDIYLDEHGFMFRKHKVSWQMLMDQKKSKVALSPEAQPYFDELMILLKEEEESVFDEESL